MDIVAALRQGGMAARVRALLLSPRQAWGSIAAEPPDPVGLYLRLVMPLAAIAPLAKLLSWSLVFGFIAPGTAVLAGLLAWVLNLVGVAVLAFAASWLSPYFEGEDHPDQAVKLVAYAATPSWLGGIFRLVPILGMLSLLTSLYSIYLVYCGAPQLLGIPPSRAPGFALALGGIAVLLYIACGVILALLLGITALGMA